MGGGLPDSDLTMQEAQVSSPDLPICPACGGVGEFRLEGDDITYFATDYHARLFRCGDCGIDFQHPMPTRDVIAAFYPGGYWLESLSKSPLARLMRFYVDGMLDLDLMRWFRKMGLRKGDRYLDLGCSRGDFLAKVCATGVTGEGIEADPQAAAHARAAFGLTVHELDLDEWQPEASEWAAMSLFHVLEHVREPRMLLQRCWKGLRPGGKLLVRVPNIRSWQSLWFGAGWKPLDLPRHLTHFHPRALVRLLESTGFHVSSRSTWTLRDGPPAWSATLFPKGEPTYQQIHQKTSSWRIAVYFGLTWTLTPLEIFAAIFGKGGMITVLAEKHE